MKILKSLLSAALDKKHFTIRLFISLFSVIGMGFNMSLLIQADFGIDPCTLFLLALSNKLGIDLGPCQACFNVILFVIVIAYGIRNLGFGTLFNMFLAGYNVQFFTWVWGKVIPKAWLSMLSFRLCLLIPALFFFCIAVALYMNVDMGITPYDALPVMIANALPKIPFKYVRIGFDFTVTLIGVLLGGKFGVMTVLLILLLGPTISHLGEYLKKHVKLFQDF